MKILKAPLGKNQYSQQTLRAVLTPFVLRRKVHFNVRKGSLGPVLFQFHAIKLCFQLIRNRKEFLSINCSLLSVSPRLKRTRRVDTRQPNQINSFSMFSNFDGIFYAFAAPERNCFSPSSPLRLEDQKKIFDSPTVLAKRLCARGKKYFSR